MDLDAENDLCEQISHLYLLFKIETFNNKKVMEVSFIKSVYLLISFDSHGFVIHFDHLNDFNLSA